MSCRNAWVTTWILINRDLDGLRICIDFVFVLGVAPVDDPSVDPWIIQQADIATTDAVATSRIHQRPYYEGCVVSGKRYDDTITKLMAV